MVAIEWAAPKSFEAPPIVCEGVDTDNFGKTESMVISELFVSWSSDYIILRRSLLQPLPVRLWYVMHK